MKNKILIIGGDPNSINSEVIIKSWKKLKKNLRERILIVADYNLMVAQAKRLNLRIKFQKYLNKKSRKSSNILNIIDVPLKFKSCFKVSKKDSSKYILRCINYAHKLAQKGKIKGFINCPINKELLSKNKTIGVTELLAKKSNLKKFSEVMMLYNPELAVVPITTHISIKEISKKITKELLLKKIIVLNNSYIKIFKKKPKIALLGLNPHNAEFNKKSEEVKIIIPTIKKLKKRNLNINGPYVADSFFINEFKKFDVAIGMYHDQVLIPFKSLFKFNAINVTLGLPYLRVSPDHGTAKNLIGKNKANFLSLLKCINFINNFNK